MMICDYRQVTVVKDAVRTVNARGGSCTNEIIGDMLSASEIRSTACSVIPMTMFFLTFTIYEMMQLCNSLDLYI